METIGIIASVIAAISAIITLIFTIRNSKGNIVKRIERKQQQVQDLEQRLYRTHGLNANIGMYPPFWKKKEKLEREIEELRKKI